MLFTIGVVIIYWFMRVPILYSITEDQRIIDQLLPLFILSVFLEPGRTFNIVMVNALRAAGDAKFPLITAVCFMWELLFLLAISLV